MAETVVVEDPEVVRAFEAAPRTVDGRVSLRVGSNHLELNRWGTLLARSLVAGGPRLRKTIRVLHIRRMKRPRAASAVPAITQAAVSTAVIAQPLDASGSTGAPAAAKPDRATRRARRRVKRYASGRILIAADADKARAFLERALATSEPVVVTYGDVDAVLTEVGSRAVLSLFATSKIRLAFVHVMLGADRFRPSGEAAPSRATVAEVARLKLAESEPTDSIAVTPADPWGPFSGDFPISIG